ncbi:uncharacterized protein LOC110504822 isoform X1 [Oncorhynchus mykiss]|uniref:uncharacterized protein LOC110504822 isoform X1 n=1 Tax=Oncorhynchus mykiss TaxID=8022 RepID=UPI00187797DD|nr:uncharacterized protein LOC110504822 isoform X1 [Oncorhynchus mykiss]
MTRDPAQEMVPMKARTGTGLYSLACLLMISSVCSTCVPLMCLKCNLTHSPGISAAGLPDNAICDILCSDTTQCFNATIQQYCSKDFKVLLNTSSGFKVQEGDNLDIECSHNLPVEPKSPLVFVWLMDGVHLKGKNSSMLTVKKVGIDTSGKEKYACTIQSPCGNFTSEPKEIEVEVFLFPTNSWGCLSLCAVSMCVRRDDVGHSDLWCVCCGADPGHGYRHEDHAEDGICEDKEQEAAECSEPTENYSRVVFHFLQIPPNVLHEKMAKI